MEDFIEVITHYISLNFTGELTSVLVGTFLFFLYFYSKIRIKAYLKDKDQRYFYLDLATRLIVLSGFYLLFFYMETKLKIFIIGAFFKNLSLLLIIIESLKFIYKQLKISQKSLLNLIILLTSLDIGIIFLLDLFHSFSLPIGSKYSLDEIVKLLAIIPLFAFLFVISNKLVSLISTQNTLLRITLIKLVYVFNILFSILGYLWFAGFLNFDLSFLFGIILIFVLSIIYAFLVLFISNQLDTKFEIIQQTFPDIKGKIFTLLSLLFLFGVYVISILFFNIDGFIQWTKQFFIVKTDVLKISLYSLIKAIWFFMLVVNSILIIRILIRYFMYKKKGEFEPTPIEAIIYNFGVLLAGIISLSMLGITWKVLLPLIGALGIGAGFGLQSIINNYISGFIIIFNRKVEVGDIVELKGNAGQFIGNPNEIIFGIVTDIGVINTVIETIDGVSVAVPNSRFVSENIVNYTLTDNLVRLRIPFKVSYEVPREKVEKILIDTAYEYKRYLAKYYSPQVWFFEIKDYYNEFVLVMWIDARNWKKIIWLKSEIYKKAFDKFKAENIEVPVIKVDLKGSP
ncbi:MAG: hypothetical protein DSY47_07270 [Hydrogenothermus sp.]|nr:MAG: hypothetical protein DSY47_07270 [Hydrogenothermus sp.]